MKKFYATLAAVAFGCAMVSANSYVELNSHVKSLNDIKTLDLKSFNHTTVQNKFAKDLVKANQSRADEVDITTFDHSLYFDYFFVFDDPQNPNIQMSSSETELILEDDQLYISTFMGYNISPALTINAEGGLEMELGQVLVQDGDWSYVLVAIDEEEDEIMTEGAIEFEIYQNAIVCENLFGVYAFLGNEGKGFLCLAETYMVMASNATINFVNANGEEVENRIVASYDEEYQSYMISNVMSWNEGPSVEFTYNEDYDLIVAEEQICYYSQQTQDGEDTGFFYLTGLTDTDEAFITVPMSITDNVITFPADAEGLTFVGWTGLADSGYWFGANEIAKVTFDTDPGSVADIVAGQVKDNRIFNVMGVQVDENYKGIVISNGKKYIQR